MTYLKEIFEILHAKIPRQPESWTGDEVNIWLEMIGMAKY